MFMISQQRRPPTSRGLRHRHRDRRQPFRR
jgi:hypothetical protein